jgi:uncharacterized protein YggE
MSSLAGGLVLCAAAQLSAQTITAASLSEINTTGRGEIHLAPDRATVLFTIETHASSAAGASSTNSEVTSATLKAVKAAAGAQDTVTTESYMVLPDYEKGKPRGFQARNTIRVKLQDILRVGAVVDAGLAAGATQVQQIQFTASTSLAVRRQAIKLAVSEARLDAEALAEAAGGTVGKLLSVSSAGSSGIAMARLDAAVITGLAASGGTAYTPPPVLPNDVVVSAMATTKWEFIPRR